MSNNDLEEFIAEFAFDMAKKSQCVDTGDLRAWMSGHVRVPVESYDLMKETLEMIVAAEWTKWEELASPDEFVRWAKSRANHALAQLSEGHHEN